MNYIEINYENNMKMLALAIKYCSENFSHDEIINELKGDDDLKKQLCLIELSQINTQQEADILVFNLTGHSGPVRETTSYKILELISSPKYNKFFQSDNISNTFVKSITDINPSVSRNAVEIIKYVKNSQYLYENILKEINKTLSNIDIDCKNRSYVQNKKNFNLYWNLEALICIAENINSDEQLFEIIQKISLSNDYTIREKAAKAASIFSKTNPKYNEILSVLQNDENIYVRKYTKK